MYLSMVLLSMLLPADFMVFTILLVEKILQNACKCKNVSISEVVSAVKNGADTFEKVAETTGAGTACGRCKEIILNIIENKR